MSLRHLIAIFRARWVAGLIAFLVVGAVAAAFALTQPKRYTATASVLVDVKSPDPVAGMVLQGMTSPSYMLTQVDVITSVRVASLVAQRLGLLDKPEVKAQWLKQTGGKGSFPAWLAEGLQSGLDARPSRGSNVISVSYTSADPAFAAAAANAFVQGYVDTSLELRVEPARQYNKFFDSHARQLRDKLEQAQTKLSAYQQANGIIATDEKLDVETSRLAELSSQLVALQGTAAESSGRRGQATTDPNGLAEVLTNPVVASLQAELSRQEARREELSSRVGEAHPQMKELEANIALLRNRLRQETGRVSGSVRATDQVNQARLAQLRTSIDEQRAKLLHLKGQRDEANVLLQDVTNAQRAYDGVLARLNQTSLESQTAQANVSTLEMATEPSAPASPRLKVSLGLCLMAALASAVGVVAFRELRDRRLRAAEQIASVLKQPLVCVIPAFQKQSTGMLPVSPKRPALGHSLPHHAASR